MNTGNANLERRAEAEKADRRKLTKFLGGSLLAVVVIGGLAQGSNNSTTLQAPTAPSEMTNKELIDHNGVRGLTYNECLRKNRMEVRAIVMAIANSKDDPGDDNPDVQSSARTLCNMLNPGVLKDR